MPCIIQQGIGKHVNIKNKALCITYNQGKAILKQHNHININGKIKELGGLSFVLFKENKIVGIDIDHCIEAQGKPNKTALRIIDKCNSYTEISPSGTGIRIFLYGILPKNSRNRNDKLGIEIYDSNKALTVTENTYLNKPIQANQQAINYIIDKYIGYKAQDIDVDLTDISLENINPSEVEITINNIKTSTNEIYIGHTTIPEKEFFENFLNDNIQATNTISESQIDWIFVKLLFKYTQKKEIVKKIWSQSKRFKAISSIRRKASNYVDSTITNAYITLPQTNKELDKSYQYKGIPIDNLNEIKEESFIITGSCGIGKSYFFVSQSKKYLDKDKNNKVFYFTDSHNNMKVIKEYALKLGIEEKEIVEIKSQTTEEETKAHAFKRFNITTQSYLGIRGHSNKTFENIEEEIDNKTMVVIDELDRFIENRIKVNLPLATRYSLDSNNIDYTRIGQCKQKTKTKETKHKKTQENDPCSYCVLGIARRSPNKQTQERNFYHAFLKDNASKYLRNEEIANLIRQEDYTPITKTLYFKHVDRNEIKIKELEEHLNYIWDYLDNPYLKIQFPNKEENIFPKYPCQVPILSGFSRLAIDQIKQANKIIMGTATLSQQLGEYLKSITNLNIYTINKIKCTYDLTIFSTQRNIPMAMVDRILAKFKENKKCLFVLNKKSEAFNYEKLSIQKVKLYYERYYEHRLNYKYDEEDQEEKSILATYLKSAIMRGSNMPNVELMFINADDILPQSALHITKEMDSKQIYKKLLEEREIVITQNIGRILRSTVKWKTDKVVKDTKKKVIVIYNATGINFDNLEKKQFHNLQIIKEIFYPQSKNQEKAIINSINEAFENKEITNKQIQEIEELKKIPIYKQSPKQRELTKYERLQQKEELKRKKEELKRKKEELKRKKKEELKRKKKEDKQKTIIQKAKELTSHNKTMAWREFYRKYNINKYFNKEEIEELKKLFN